MADGDTPALTQTTGRQLSRTPYRGPVRVRRSDGRVERWVEGRGYVPDSAAIVAPEARELLERERGRLAQTTRNADQAQQFLRHNAQQETGGWVELLPFGLNALGRPNTQAMQGLTSQMLRENIQPGTSGTMNSEREMDLALQQYPSINASGPTNRTRALRLQIERDVQNARVSAAEAYAREHGNIDGFEQQWSAFVPQLRTRLESRYAETNGPISEQARPDGTQRPNPPPRGSVIDGYRFNGGNPADRNNWTRVR